jgi:2-polyprenyl-3-methyl-5-hydroxy-6-metoxy-1,4-benzoquinol methylase/tetratricopeptide (TPR) repeat protein
MDMDAARALFSEGRQAEALVAARAAFNPAIRDHQTTLGLICAFTGHLAEAAQHLSLGLEPGQGQTQHWRVLAAVRGQLGDRRGEAEALQEAVSIDPADPDLALFLAAAQLQAGDAARALDAALAALRLRDSTEARRLIVDAAAFGVDRTDPEFRVIIRRALAESWARPERLSRAACALIRATDLPLETDPILGELLVAGPLADADLELKLTAERARCLLAGGGPEPFLSRLARQCWINEYCWRVSPAEAAALAVLDPESPLWSLYRETEPPRPAPDIPVLTPIRSDASQEVRAMYEENPYPRWMNMPPRTPRPLTRVLQSTFQHVHVDPIEGADILVAGCGTGQHAIQFALGYENARVLAVDLSRSSLAYAARKAAELGVSHITFAQADLLELGALGRTFDAITCAGTLHHMADPFEGLRALVAMLKPGGALNLGIYSRIARRELEPAKALARTYPKTPEGVRALRAAIIDAPEGDPVRAVLTWSDFYSTSMARDLLMHVLERQLTVADIKRMAEVFGLRFLGFVAPSAVLAAYRRANPDDVAATDLDRWAAFEAANPTIFRGMYQFWMQRPPVGSPPQG